MLLTTPTPTVRAIATAKALNWKPNQVVINSVSNTDSVAEQLQRAFPRTKVVKAFNTMNAAVMVNPGAVGAGDTTVFVAGNDTDARATVAGVAGDLGWTDVLDLGDLTAARGLEMWLPLWLRLLMALGGPMFNIKVAR